MKAPNTNTEIQFVSSIKGKEHLLSAYYMPSIEQKAFTKTATK